MISFRVQVTASLGHWNRREGEGFCLSNVPNLKDGGEMLTGCFIGSSTTYCFCLASLVVRRDWATLSLGAWCCPPTARLVVGPAVSQFGCSCWCSPSVGCSCSYWACHIVVQPFALALAPWYYHAAVRTVTVCRWSRAVLISLFELLDSDNGNLSPSLKAATVRRGKTWVPGGFPRNRKMDYVLTWGICQKRSWRSWR